MSPKTIPAQPVDNPVGQVDKADGRPLTWSLLWRLLPMSKTKLALAMLTNRQSLWNLEHGQHRRPPGSLLSHLAATLSEHPLLNGQRPTKEALVELWLAEFALVP